MSGVIAGGAALLLFQSHIRCTLLVSPLTCLWGGIAPQDLLCWERGAGVRTLAWLGWFSAPQSIVGISLSSCWLFTYEGLGVECMDHMVWSKARWDGASLAFPELANHIWASHFYSPSLILVFKFLLVSKFAEHLLTFSLELSCSFPLMGRQLCPKHQSIKLKRWLRGRECAVDSPCVPQTCESPF